MIINNISTQKCKDRGWDSYRNHIIGFAFQGYNLIPHQTILSNVELALTISGISKKERLVIMVTHNSELAEILINPKGVAAV